MSIHAIAPMPTGRENLAAVFEQADRIDRAAGLSCYFDYHRLLTDLAHLYGFPVHSVVAAFCALSPNNDYMGNLRSLVAVLKGINERRPNCEITVSTYKACRDRAIVYATGQLDFLTTTRGEKTRAFYRNIYDPADPEPVTVDGHMVGMWLGKRVRMVEAARLRAEWSYAEIAEDVRRLAAAKGLIPNQLQATLWFTWKRVHNVLYDPRMALFGEDHWRSRIDAALVKEYAPKPGQGKLDWQRGVERGAEKIAQMSLVMECEDERAREGAGD